MNRPPKVSIVIPVYNGSNYLASAIDSALAQTYHNIEVVVVNDGSTDGGSTAEIARRYADKVKYVEQQNAGVAGALNTGIANLTGDIFAWLSHDDVYLPDKIAKNVDYHARLGRSNAIVFSNYFLIDPQGNRIQEVKFDHTKFVHHPMLPLLNGCINGCTLFIPMEILHNAGPFDRALRFTQDYALWSRILCHHEFYHQPESLVEYRIHPGQDTQAMKASAVVEGNRVWKSIVDDRTEIERVQLHGSSKKYFRAMAEFLDTTPYRDAAGHARVRAARAVQDTLVSIIIPFFNEVGEVETATRSALSQSHKNIDVILVNDGSTESAACLEALADDDPRVQLIMQPNAGPGAARNFGLEHARGDYVAFLDGDDLFLQEKIEIQLASMQQFGSQVSHTSYFVRYRERFSHDGVIRSGEFGGMVYPEIIAKCPIATPTVMLHRSVISQGFRFPTQSKVGEDVLFWIALAKRYELLGIEEPLTVVGWATNSAAIDLEKSYQGIAYLIGEVKRDPLHARHKEEILTLERVLAHCASLIEKVRERQRANPDTPMVNEWAISNVFHGTGDLGGALEPNERRPSPATMRRHDGGE